MSIQGDKKMSEEIRIRLFLNNIQFRGEYSKLELGGIQLRYPTDKICELIKDIKYMPKINIVFTETDEYVDINNHPPYCTVLSFIFKHESSSMTMDVHNVMYDYVFNGFSGSIDGTVHSKEIINGLEEGKFYTYKLEREEIK
jgi:hypothetical protein